MKILIANGVNLDLLGTREPDIYGHRSLSDLTQYVGSHLDSVAKAHGFSQVELDWFQTNSEQEYLEKLTDTYHGFVLNPGAWTHTSLALADRVKGIGVPFVEVHLSQVAAREHVRQTSYCAPHAIGLASGFGFDSYIAGLWGLLSYLKSHKPKS